MMDAEYMRLYRAYKRAMIALQVALDRRRRIRRQIAERRKPRSGPRRIVGVRPGAQHYEAPVGPPAPRPTPPPFRVYMGKILGWQEFKAMPTEPSDVVDPALDVDFDALADDVSRKQLWRARRDYEEARKAFFDYMRRLRTEAFRRSAAQARRHLKRAAEYTSYAANLQLLGLDNDVDVDRMAEARAEVVAFCGEIWEAYRKARESPVAHKALVAAVAEAQLVGADEEGAVPDMLKEVYRVVEEAGKAPKAPKAPKTPGATPRPPGRHR